MLTTFEATFGRVKQLVADFWTDEKFHLSPACQEDEARHAWETGIVASSPRLDLRSLLP